MKKVIGIALSLIMISLLAYGVSFPDSLVMLMVVGVVWTFIQVGTVYAVIGMCLLYLAERLAEPQRRKTLTELRRLFCQRNHYSAGKAHIWCESSAIVICLVLTGWSLTALSFILVAAMAAYTNHTILQSAGKWTAC